MYVIIPKNASPVQVKKLIAEFEKKRSRKKEKGRGGNLAKFFGSNPAEADGLKFQKKVRAEWD
jgi:hypothetical protein